MADYQIKEMQQHILSVLLRVDQVCREHGIKYYISDGTMLGAVRHGGFVPWDDDADIDMPRPDYQRFLAHANEWLPKPLEMVCIEQDDRCMCTFMKIIDGSTTLIERWGLNQLGGVYIDVFPIDGVSKTKWKRKLRFSCFHAMKSLIYLRNRDPYKRGHGYTSWLPRLIQNSVKNVTLHRWLQRIAKKYVYEDSELIADYDSGERSVMPKEVMGTPTPILFEGHELLGVQYPEEYLRRLFGDYMKLPPENKRRIHGFDYVDFKHSYHDYHDTRSFK